MNIIKLNAIDSTNVYLKDLSGNFLIDNYTVVVADTQNKGRGQRGASWVSESGKNLTFSVFCRFLNEDKMNLFLINAIVALSIVEVLENVCDSFFSIKWPNDILSENKKIGGILIENIFKSTNEIYSIIGIGLNVNQNNFQGLDKASSLSLLENKVFDKDVLLEMIVLNLKRNIENKENEHYFWDQYHKYLFKKGIPSVFSEPGSEKFMGIIQGVTKEGKLILTKENEMNYEFDLKEVAFHY